jgi:hypothetical protein
MVTSFGESPFSEDYQEDPLEQKPPWIVASYHTEPYSTDELSTSMTLLQIPKASFPATWRSSSV